MTFLLTLTLDISLTLVEQGFTALWGVRRRPPLLFLREELTLS